MKAWIKVLSPGLLSSIQDYGRPGFANVGVPRSGAADRVSLMIGNALVDNDPYEAAIEFRLVGLTISCQKGAVRIGLAGNASAELTVSGSDQKRSISPWQTVTLVEGDTLKLSSVQDGATGYLTVQGGLELTPVLGSYSTYARAGLGGATGNVLQVGDILTTNQVVSPGRIERIVARPFQIPDKKLRVILGPQDDYFSKNQISKFLLNQYDVTSDVDRMGIRLNGPKIKHLPDKGSDLVSDGLVTGAIQVPGNGQPIILGVDCQSVGGYPKIATVISADLHCLGQIVAGDKVHFQAVDTQQARKALLELQKSIKSAIASFKDFMGEGAINLDALYKANLIDGVVNAYAPEDREKE